MKLQAKFVVLTLFAATLAFLPSAFIPCTPVDGLWEAFYGTDEVPVCALLGWQVMLLIGFMYTSHSVCERPNALLDRAGEYKTVVQVQVVGFLLFWIGPAFTLAGPCGSVVGRPRQVFAHNALLAVGFSAGLQYTFLDQPELQGLVLSLEAARKYTRLQWAVLVGAVVAVLGALGYSAYVLAEAGRLAWYAAGIAIVLAAVAGAAFALCETHYFHGHHYAVFLALIPLFPGQHLLSALCMGLVTGVFVEGAARWRMDPIFEKKRRRDSYGVNVPLGLEGAKAGATREPVAVCKAEP